MHEAVTVQRRNSAGRGLYLSLKRSDKSQRSHEAWNEVAPGAQMFQVSLAVALRVNGFGKLVVINCGVLSALLS